MLADRDRKLDPTRDTGRGGGRHVSTGKILSASCDQVWDQDVECRKLSQQTQDLCPEEHNDSDA